MVTVTLWTADVNGDGERIGEPWCNTHTFTGRSQLRDAAYFIESNGLTEYSSSEYTRHGWWSSPDGPRVDNFCSDLYVEDTARVTGTDAQTRSIYKLMTGR